MKRKWLVLLCLLSVAVFLTGCTNQPQQQQVFSEVTQYLGPASAVTASPVPVNNNSDGISDASQPQGNTTGDDSTIFSNNPYVVDPNAADPNAVDDLTGLGEEDYVDNGVFDDGSAVVYGLASAETTYYPYAGSTPIPLLPVDAPTPTPRPPVTFTMVDYSPTIGLTFQAPAGWIPDESVPDTFTLSEPEQQIKDGQLGVLTLNTVLLNANYSEKELAAEVKQRLDAIGGTNFVEWRPSMTATRHLMGTLGVYANFSGTMANGVQVGGRIHVVSIDSKLYCLQITYPLGFKTAYEDVFSTVRSSLKLVR